MLNNSPIAIKPGSEGRVKFQDIELLKASSDCVKANKRCDKIYHDFFVSYKLVSFRKRSQLRFQIFCDLKRMEELARPKKVPLISPPPVHPGMFHL